MALAARLLAIATVAIIAAASAPDAGAQGQRSAAVAGGYSFLTELDTPGITHDYPVGWFASYETPRLVSRLAIAAEITGSQRTNDVGETQRLLAFLVGPRIALVGVGRFEVSGVFLLGSERFSEPGFSESGLAIEPGATIDIPVAGRFGGRVGAGYRLVRAGGDTFKELRVSAGAVVRLGPQ